MSLLVLQRIPGEDGGGLYLLQAAQMFKQPQRLVHRRRAGRIGKGGAEIRREAV